MVIDSVHYHSKEVTSMCEKNKGGRSCVYSASMDGHLRLYEESNGASCHLFLCHACVVVALDLCLLLTSQIPLP